MILLRVIPQPTRPDMADLHCAYNESAIEQFKAVPACRWNKAQRVWQAPVEAAGILAKRLQKAKIAKLRGELPTLPPPVELPPHDKVYSYQNAGIEFIVDRCKRLGGALLADEAGVGKSVQALLSSTHTAPNERTLIVSPAVVAQHWMEEAERWLGKPASRVHSTSPRWKGVGVTTYGVLTNILGRPHHLEWQHPTSKEWFRHAAYADLRKAEWDLEQQQRDDREVQWRLTHVPNPLPPIGTLILDEIHYLSSYRAQRSKAIRTLIKKQRPAAIIGLSGTPLTTRPRDLWNPLDLLYPGRFGRYWDYARRYCEAHQKEVEGLEEEVWDTSGASNLDELSERLKPLMLRRTKGEVLELPPRQRVMLPVELPKRAGAALAIAYEDAGEDEAIKTALTGTEGHKVPHAVELATDLVKQGHRVLLLTTRKATAADIAKKLKKAKINTPIATGDTPPDRRAKLLNAARDAAVATIYAVTTGINLVGFDAVIFVGLDWVPSTLLQAEARPHRIGTEKKITYYYLIGMGSIDEVIRSAVIERLDHFATLMGDQGEELDLARTLGKETEEEVIAAIVEMVREKSGGRRGAGA